MKRSQATLESREYIACDPLYEFGIFFVKIKFATSTHEKLIQARSYRANEQKIILRGN